VKRPLVVTDCDEVLLHFARHFREWAEQEHGLTYLMQAAFGQSLFDVRTGQPAPPEHIWDLLHRFFETEMSRQTPIEGAVSAMSELQQGADVVVLTNIQDRFNAPRSAQLRAFGLEAEVFTNQGPKGPALQRIIERFSPSRAVFIDDLAHHHQSAAETLPDISRLHLCGEPELAPHVPCALQSGHAHARLDTWDEALPWLLERLHGERS
jgi:hypothetical protein